MSFKAMILLTCIALLLPQVSHAKTKGSVSVGIKSENLRFGGGRVVSKNPVIVSSGQVTYDSGVYLRYWGTVGEKESDAELDIGIGFLSSCLGTLICKGEVMYWILPALDRNKGDLLNLSLEIGGSEELKERLSVGYFLRAEKLFVSGRPDFELFRLGGHMAFPVGAAHVKLAAEYAYNSGRDWHHIPLGLSATFAPAWLPEDTTLTPSVDLLIPLNEQESRDVGIAVGVALSKKW